LIEVRLGRQHSSTSLAITIIQARAPCPNEAEGHCAISSGGRRAGSLRRAILGKLITPAEVGGSEGINHVKTFEGFRILIMRTSQTR
jgi:hypothetical protein